MLPSGRSNLHRGRSLKIRSSNSEPAETKNGASTAGLGDIPHILLLTKHNEREPTYSTMNHGPVPENLKSVIIPLSHKSAKAGATLAGGREAQGSATQSLPSSGKTSVLDFLEFWFQIFQSSAPRRTCVFGGVWQSGFRKYSAQSPGIHHNSSLWCPLETKRQRR